MIDHLVYATSDVDSSVEVLEQRLGVRAGAGGRHLGYGTRNALLSLGPDSYLEIIGPDPGQRPPARGYWYGIDSITSPRLVTWTARVEYIERVAAHAHAAGYNPGDVHKVYRELPDGGKISWRLTLPTGAGDGLVPNLIEWDEGTPHPATTSPEGSRTGPELSASVPDSSTFRALPPGPNLAPPKIGEHEMVFHWQAVAGAAQYHFQLATDRDFEDIVSEQTVHEPHAVIVRPIPERYYFRARTLDSLGYAGPFGVTYEVSVPPTSYWPFLIIFFPLLL